MNFFEMKQGQEELRKNNRVYLRSLFPKDSLIRYRAGNWAHNEEGVLHSLSQSGLFVKGKRIPEIGDRIAINFDFGGDPVQCQGQVIYQNQEDNGLNVQGFGVKFTRMFGKDYENIRQSIDSFFNVTHG